MLVDRFGRVHDYLRISVTDRCNLRCVYCMPPEGIVCRERDELLSFEEILRVTRVMAAMGVHKVRLTGGEPTVRRNLEDLIAGLSAIRGIEAVAMTTNGVLFAEKAEIFREAGLSSVNISLDSLDRDNFRRIALRDEFDRVMRSIECALSLGYSPLKINMVVMPGVNDHEVLDFVNFAHDQPVNVRFIEYMPFKGNRWDPQGFVPFAQIKASVAERYELLPLPDNYLKNRIARDYVIPGFRGTISFISSLTDSFCDRCSRLRITSDGALKACLFFPAQANLRPILRSTPDDDILAEAIRAAVLEKPKGHPDLDELPRINDLSMIEIGG